MTDVSITPLLMKGVEFLYLVFLQIPACSLSNPTELYSNFNDFVARGALPFWLKSNGLGSRYFMTDGRVPAKSTG